MSNTLRLAEQLISRASVTPEDAGCQTIISDLLKPLGFSCETVISGPDSFKVENLLEVALYKHQKRLLHPLLWRQLLFALPIV